MRLRWTPNAAADLETIYFYLRQNHPSDVESTIRTLYDTARSLRTMPDRGRRGVIDGTRELILPKLPYILVYRIREELSFCISTTGRRIGGLCPEVGYARTGSLNEA